MGSSSEEEADALPPSPGVGWQVALGEVYNGLPDLGILASERIRGRPFMRDKGECTASERIRGRPLMRDEGGGTASQLVTGPPVLSGLRNLCAGCRSDVSRGFAVTWGQGCREGPGLTHRGPMSYANVFSREGWIFKIAMLLLM